MMAPVCGWPYVSSSHCSSFACTVSGVAATAGLIVETRNVKDTNALIAFFQKVVMGRYLLWIAEIFIASRKFRDKCRKSCQTCSFSRTASAPDYSPRRSRGPSPLLEGGWRVAVCAS